MLFPFVTLYSVEIHLVSYLILVLLSVALIQRRKGQRDGQNEIKK